MSEIRTSEIRNKFCSVFQMEYADYRHLLRTKNYEINTSKNLYGHFQFLYSLLFIFQETMQPKRPRWVKMINCTTIFVCGNMQTWMLFYLMHSGSTMLTIKYFFGPSWDLSDISIQWMSEIQTSLDFRQFIFVPFPDSSDFRLSEILNKTFWFRTLFSVWNLNSINSTWDKKFGF